MEVRVKEEPADTNVKGQIQIDLITDWIVDRNMERRDTLDGAKPISSEILPSMEMESHVRWRTFSGPEMDNGQDETNPRSEHVEEFIRDPLRTQTPSIDDEVDIKYEGNWIENNSTSNAEGFHDSEPGPDTYSMSSNMNTNPGTRCPINSEQIELSEFYLRLLQCEQDCETCQKYIRKLSEHIRATHAASSQTCDPLLIDPPDMDQSSATEIKSEAVEDIETERIDYSEEPVSDPDYNRESGSESDPDYAPSPVLTRKERLPNTNLSRHISTDPTGDKRYGSEGCGKGEGIHTGKKQSETRFKCTDCGICGEGYMTKSLLTIHMRTHTGERPFKCGECTKSYSRKDHLDRHVRSHTGEKPFECDLCLKGFTTNNSLTIHKKDHAGDRQFKCDKCSKSYSQRSNLDRHKRSHTEEKPFKCNLCLKGFSTKGYMTVHMRGHTGDKPFKCDECNKSFLLKSNLYIHTRSHTGDRPFKCDECNKGFSQKCNFDYHMRSHTGEKPYTCKDCGRSFKTNFQLILHMRSHTGEKPFQCTECKKSFSHKSHLHRHLRTHTLGKLL